MMSSSSRVGRRFFFGGCTIIADHIRKQGQRSCCDKHVQHMYTYTYVYIYIACSGRSCCGWSCCLSRPTIYAYLYMHTYVIYIYVYIYIYIQTYIHTYVHMYVCMYVYVCSCVNVCMYVYTYVCMYVTMYVSMYVCICMSIMSIMQQQDRQVEQARAPAPEVAGRRRITPTLIAGQHALLRRMLTYADVC